jgi:hypothetical protein
LSDFIAASDPLLAKMRPDMLIHHAILKKLDDNEFIGQLVNR